MITGFLCKIGYHPEKFLEVEVHKSPFTQIKKVYFKCSKCGKIFQRYTLGPELYIRRINDRSR